MRFVKLYPYMMFASIFGLYWLTLLPGIGQADTAEFQRVLLTHQLPHPTGYPLYSIVGWVWTHLPFGGTPAWRANLLSALFGAWGCVIVAQIGRLMRLHPLFSTAAALSLATSLAFWVQATRAEVYALAILIQMLLVWSLLLWRSRQLPLWVVGLIIGLGLAHHRMIVLMVPGVLWFLWSEGWIRRKDLVFAILASVIPTALYLQILGQLPPWIAHWEGLKSYVFAQEYSTQLIQPDLFIRDGFDWPLTLIRTHLGQQFWLLGVPLQVLGAIRLNKHDRPLARLILSSMVLIFLFCGIYAVSDIDVFLIPLYALGAILLGQGCAWLSERIAPRAARRLIPVVLLLPGLLLLRNWNTLRTINSTADEAIARAIMTYPFPDQALVIGEWSRIESLRYLQHIEALHPTLEMQVTYSPAQMLPLIQSALNGGRPVYLLSPAPDLGLRQVARGPVWQVENQPLEIEPSTAANIRWDNGIALIGYDIKQGPYRPAESIPVVMEWQAWDIPPHSYSVFIHLIDEHGQIWSQFDGVPQTQTDSWRTDATYGDLYALLLNPEIPPGRYHVKVGWYRYPSLERLALIDPPPAASDYVILGEIQVQQ